MSAEIKRAKTEKWTEFLAEADTSSIWTIGKMVEAAPRDGGSTRIPELIMKEGGQTKVVRDNEGKVEAFKQAFFPPPPTISNVPTHPIYPPPAWHFTPPTNRQIKAAFRKMKNGKATRPGSFPNDLYKATSDVLIPYLGPIYRATFTLRIYPEDWALIETLIMRKPGKPDYRVPGAHQPIVLSHGHARALNACIADEITRRVELLGLIPTQQFGARPGRNTTDSIHMMVDSIKEAWRKGEVASVLYMDVKGAFPSVDLQMLYHELLSLGVPPDLVDWLKRRYANRTTQMVFDDFVSEPMKVLGGRGSR